MSSRKQESARITQPSGRTSSSKPTGGDGSTPPRSRRHPSSFNGARKWPVENISRWPISALLPYARNPKTHPPAQIDLIARSLARWGQAQIVLVDGDDGPAKGEIIAGHGRVLAAEQLGWNEVIVGEARGWSDEEKRGYRIADNELGSERLAPYDVPALTFEVAELKLAGFDMPLLGFENIYLERLTAGKPGKHPETTPLVPPNPCVLPGDLWLLGKHRLLCGSATEAKDVERLLNGEKPALMVTDPPYGVNYDPEWRNRSGLNAWAAMVQVGQVDADHKADWTEAWKLFPGDVAYVWHAGKFAGEVQASLIASDLHPRSQIIWRKPHFAIGRGDYHWRHEPCWYCVRKGKKSNWRGGRKQTTVWDILGFQVAGGHRDEAKTGHGTQKPLDCMSIPIANNSAPGELVYDPFVGSGTTIMAAETQARRCAAIDINPAYVEVSIKRWQDFTGKSATLEDGRTFDDVRKERLQKGNRRKPISSKHRRRAPAEQAIPDRGNA